LNITAIIDVSPFGWGALQAIIGKYGSEKGQFIMLNNLEFGIFCL